MISGLRKPVPANQHKPAKRLPKGSAMTLGIGFQCQDAIVMCADTLITYEDSHKGYEHKIYRHPPEQKFSVMATYCGFPNTMTNFVSKFEDQMQRFSPKNEPITAFGIQNVIESVLKSGEFGDDFWLLCGICVPNKELRLVKAWGQRVGPCSTAWDCIGSGDSSLIKCLGSLLANSSDGYSIRQAELLGLYILRQATRWIDGVGGELDVFTLQADGRIVPSSLIPLGVGARFDILERYLSPVAEAFFDNRLSEQELDRRIQALTRSIKENKSLM